MTDQQASDLTDALASAAASVAAATNALEAGLSRPQLSLIVDALKHQAICLADFADCKTLLALPVPSFRQAAVALARELQAANAALTPKVLAAEQRPACNVVALATMALTLQNLAAFLMNLWWYHGATHRDADLAFRVMAAGEAIITGSMANSLWPDFDTIALTAVLRCLDRMSTLDEGHKRSLAALRVTIFRPEAILTVLQRLLPDQDPTGVFHCGENEGLADALDFIIRDSSCFVDERDAIKGDMQLQAAIVASLDENIRRFVRLSGEGPRQNKILYINACRALRVLASPVLGAAMREWTANNPAGLINMLTDCFDFILERSPSVMDQFVESVQRHAISSWLVIVTCTFLEPDHGRCGWPPFLAASLGCIQRAAAAVVFMLQQPDADEMDVDNALQMLIILVRYIRPFYFTPGVGAAVVEATDAALCALYLSFFTALESITRMAVLLLSHRQLRHLTDEHKAKELLTAYKEVMEITMIWATLCWPTEQPLPNAVASQATMMAAAGMVESVGKLARITAGRMEDMPQSGALKFGRKVFMFMSLTCSHLVIKMSPLMAAGAMAADTVKCWQGVALASSSMVMALARSDPLDLPIKLLPLSLVSWPGICNFLLEAPVGRSAVHQALEGALVGCLGEDRLHSDERIAFDILARGGNDAALALARGGVLTQLASWGEVQCEKPPSDASVSCLSAYPACWPECSDNISQLPLQECLLQLVWDLVERAALSSGAAEAQRAYTLLAEDVSITSADCWRRLRAEVIEPLAAALEAKASAENDPAQLAVDVAEALATRTCAYVRCTTVVGIGKAAAPCGKRCGGCLLVRYCSTACQRADWRFHKVACRELGRRSAGSS